MHKIEKFLKKLSDKERKEIKKTIESILSDKRKNIDIKRLKGIADVYRVRKGSIRIIFKKTRTKIVILSIERRSEQTYK